MIRSEEQRTSRVLLWLGNAVFRRSAALTRIPVLAIPPCRSRPNGSSRQCYTPLPGDALALLLSNEKPLVSEFNSRRNRLLLDLCARLLRLEREQHQLESVRQQCNRHLLGSLRQLCAGCPLRRRSNLHVRRRHLFVYLYDRRRQAHSELPRANREDCIHDS